jgi:uncharacterized protein YbaP (TraB family)
MRGRWLRAERLLIGLIGLLGTLSPTSPARAAEAPRAFLWKITGAKAPSWILGTIHLARPDVATPPPVVQAALDRADAVYTEIPMDAATIREISPHLLLPAGKTLSGILGPKLTAALRTEFTRGGGGSVTASMWTQLRPWAAAVSLLELDDAIRFPGAAALDMTIFQGAVTAGKTTGGLETPAEQLAIFDDLSDAEQTALVEDTLAQLRDARASGTNLSDHLAALYLAGDLDTLVTELNRLDAAGNHPALSAKLLDRLLYQRNVRLAQRIVQKLRAAPGTSFFFALGAAHLQGPRGVLAALEKAGYHLARSE